MTELRNVEADRIRVPLQGLQLVDVRVLDHMVVGRSGVVSFELYGSNTSAVNISAQTTRTDLTNLVLLRLSHESRVA